MRYVAISTAPYPGTDDDGNPVTLAAGTVVNAILWDGITPYDPGPDLRLEQSDTLQIGDVA
jgi:hypothetical protein